MEDEKREARNETAEGKRKGKKNVMVNERELLERHHDRKRLNQGSFGPMVER